MAEGYDTIVIGGGIAGVAALDALAMRGDRVLLLERDNHLAAHASGNNAAIFRPLEHDHTTAELARRSLERMSALASEPVLRRVGVVLVAREHSLLDAALAHGRSHGVEVVALDRAALQGRIALLTGGDVQGGVLLPTGGVLDIHAMVTALSQHARALGGQIAHSVAVREIRVLGGRVQGVLLADGRRIDAPRVVIAAGAWSAQLGAGCGSSMPLQPVRRHLVQLRAEAPADPQQPVVWRLDADAELYFRPESGGYLASPCDAVPVEPGPAPTDPTVLDLLGNRIASTAPALCRARVQHAWACLRTFAPDAELVLGPDPQVAGLYWFSGLGGRGMAVAVGAAEVLAAIVGETDHPLSQRCSPARLVGEPRRG